MFIYCICTQYLVGAPFALITASIRRGMEVISLWHCWGGMEAQVSLTVAFRSSALLGLVSLIFLLTIPHRFSMGFRSGEFAGQSSTVTPWSLNQLLVPLAVWAGTIIPVPKKSPVSCINDYRPIALTPIMMKCFERLVMHKIKTSLPNTLDPLQFAYSPNRSTDDAISSTLHLALTHQENKDSYVRINLISQNYV